MKNYLRILPMLLLGSLIGFGSGCGTKKPEAEQPIVADNPTEEEITQAACDALDAEAALTTQDNYGLVDIDTVGSFEFFDLNGTFSQTDPNPFQANGTGLTFMVLLALFNSDDVVLALTTNGTALCGRTTITFDETIDGVGTDPTDLTNAYLQVSAGLDLLGIESATVVFTITDKVNAKVTDLKLKDRDGPLGMEDIYDAVFSIHNFNNISLI